MPGIAAKIKIEITWCRNSSMLRRIARSLSSASLFTAYRRPGRSALTNFDLCALLTTAPHADRYSDRRHAAPTDRRWLARPARVAKETEQGCGADVPLASPPASPTSHAPLANPPAARAQQLHRGVGPSEETCGRRAQADQTPWGHERLSGCAHSRCLRTKIVRGSTISDAAAGEGLRPSASASLLCLVPARSLPGGEGRDVST